MRLHALKAFTLLVMLFAGAVTASAQTLDQTDEILAENPELNDIETCLLYTSPSPRDQRGSRMPSSA